MRLFKKGDKVRCIKKTVLEIDTERHGRIGRIYTVREDQDALNPDILRFLEIENSYASRFELIESELEELVRTANLGGEAVKRLLTDFKGQVEYDGLIVDGIEALADYPKNPYVRKSSLAKYKVKTPVFEPFKIGELAVALNAHLLTVGCVNFAATEVLIALQYLCSGDGYSHGSFKASRLGVHYNTYHISWEAADKLLKALEKAGV